MSDSQIEELLARWEAYREAGVDISLEDLCCVSPELIPALREQIQYILLAERYLSLDDRDCEAHLPDLRLEHYAILKPIGVGGTSQVYSAEDTRTGERVAVKILIHDRRFHPAEIVSEFRHLSRVTHENLATLYEMQAHDHKLILIMELVEQGVPLHDYLTLAQRKAMQHGDYNEYREAVRRVFTQLALGLHHLHAHGVLHLDIKPSNVLVDALGIVKILDFGLTALTHPSRAAGPWNRRGGTLPYLAPELAAQGIRSPACDWWSVGRMLLDALTELPSDTRRPEPTVAATLPQHAVPPELHQLALALLNEDPSRRPNGREVLRQFALDGAQQLDAQMLHGPETPFLGRGSQLAALQSELSHAQATHTQIVVVQGPAGIGKTALIEEFLQQTALNPHLIFHVKCYEREFVKGKVLDEVVQALMTHAMTHHSDETLAALNNIGTDWLQAFPFLFHLEKLKAFSMLPQERLDTPSIRTQSERAIQRIASLISKEQPAVLWVDDAQWLEPAELIQLIELVAAADIHFLVVVSRRPDSTPGEDRLADPPRSPLDPPLLHIPTVTNVEIGPLPERESLAVVYHYLPQAPSALAHEITHQSQGHPLFLRQLCQHLAHSHGDLQSAPGSRLGTLESMILASWRGLNSTSRAILATVALAASPIPESVVMRSSGVPSLRRRDIRYLQVAGLTRALPGPDADVLVDTYHDLYRSLIIPQIEPECKRQIHEALARQLVAQNYDDLALVAYHYHQAGCLAAAMQAYLTAGDKEAQRFSFDRATELYERARQVASSTDLNTVPIVRRLAVSLFEAGRPQENAPQCLALARQAPRELSLDLQAKAVALLIRAGKLSLANEVAGQLFTELKIKIPKYAWQRHLGMIWNLLKLVRTRSRLADAVQLDVDEDTRVRMWAYAFIGAYFCMTDGSRGPWMVTKGFRLSLQNGDATSLLHGASTHLVILSYAGRQFLQRCQQLIPELQRLASHVDDPILWSGVHLATGLHHMTCGKWFSSLECWSQATELLRGATGKVQANIGQLRFFSTWSMFMTGQIAHMSTRIPDWLRQADDVGDVYIACMLRGYYANAIWLAADQVARAQHEIARAKSDWTDPQMVMQHVYWLFAEVNILLYQGDGPGAWRTINDGVTVLKRSGASGVQFLWAEYQQFRARSALMAFNETRQSYLLKEAAKSVRQLRKMRAPWCDAWASAIDLLLGISRRHDTSVTNLYHRACNLLMECDMPVHAASLSIAFGKHGVTGDASTDRDAWQVLTAQGLQAPRTFARMLFPT